MVASISVIIPCLNEERNLAELLPLLTRHNELEVIVVDGGSSDRSCQIAKNAGCILLNSHKGRGRQMNSGASIAKHRYFLFLHADTRLPEGFIKEICKTLKTPGVAGGAFQLSTDVRGVGLGFICFWANMRSKFLNLPYGDQAIFTLRSCFHRVGGFSEIEIMEDFIFVRRLRKIGKIATLPKKVITSGRRWQKLGIIRTTLINQLVVLGFMIGIHPSRLARLYQRRESDQAKCLTIKKEVAAE